MRAIKRLEVAEPTNERREKPNWASNSASLNYPSCQLVQIVFGPSWVTFQPRNWGHWRGHDSMTRAHSWSSSGNQVQSRSIAKLPLPREVLLCQNETGPGFPLAQSSAYRYENFSSWSPA